VPQPLPSRPSRSELPDWTFLTNHAHVLLCLAEDSQIRLRSVADRVGITERAVQRIVTELVDSSYITRQRNGRRNSYIVHRSVCLRHPLLKHCSISHLLGLIGARKATVHGESAKQ
jgi:hypothetical protein